MSFQEPINDVAQLAMVELFTPTIEESRWFFHDVLGMTETGNDGTSCYLRGYEDTYHHSLKLTRAPQAGVGVTVWRVSSPQALERRVAALEASDNPGKWVENNTGYGRAYEFSSPGGHKQHLAWDVEYFRPNDEQKSKLLSRPQKRPLRGVPVRRIDHVNLLCKDVSKDSAFMQEKLGFRKRENVVLGGDELAAWMSVSALVHEVAFTKDNAGPGNRLHHLAFWFGNPGQMLDLADIVRDYGLKLEAGPGKHGVSQAYFLYIIEPGGNRIELFGDAGYLIFDPDWKTRTWDESNFMDGGAVWFGGDLPQDFFVYGTPIIEAAMAKAASNEVQPAE